MKRSSTSKKKKLPKWATYHPHDNSTNSSSSSSSTTTQQVQSEHKLQTTHEEKLLRTKAYHHICTHILQRHFDDLMECHLQQRIVTPLSHFMRQFQPNGNGYRDDGKDEEDDGDSNLVPSIKRRKLDDGTHNVDTLKEQLMHHIHQHPKQVNQKQYHPTLLPIGIIHVQPSIVDRTVISHALKDQFLQSMAPSKSTQTQDKDHPLQSQYHPTICLLSETEILNGGSGKFGDNVKNNRVESYLLTILNQVGSMKRRNMCLQ